MPSYCDGPTFVMFYDPDRTAQLLSTPSNPVTPSQVSTNSIVLLKLQSTSGLIDAAVRVGNRYAIQDLFNFVTSGQNGGVLLQRMNADLAYKEICDFKGYSEEEVKGMAPSYLATVEYLEMLRRGDRIFDIGPTAQAGLPAGTEAGIIADSYGATIFSKNRCWGIYNYPYPGSNSYGYGGG